MKKRLFKALGIIICAAVRLSDDSPDGSRLLLLDAKLCFNALCYEEKEIDILMACGEEGQIHAFGCRGRERWLWDGVLVGGVADQSFLVWHKVIFRACCMLFP